MTMNTRTSSSVALPSSLMKEETETEEEEEAEHHIRRLQQQKQQQRRQRHKDNPGDLDIMLVVKKDKKKQKEQENTKGAAIAIMYSAYASKTIVPEQSNCIATTGCKPIYDSIVFMIFPFKKYSSNEEDTLQ